MNSKFPVTFYDIKGNPVLGVLDGENGKFPVTAYDTDGNYVNLASSGGGGAVDSVNGQTGVVILTANDVGAPDFDYLNTYFYTKAYIDVNFYDKEFIDDNFPTFSYLAFNYVSRATYEEDLVVDLATMTTPQPLTTTPTELLIESNTDNVFNFDPVEHSFTPIESGSYEAKIQVSINATSNGSVFKSGYDVDGVIFQGEEQAVDSGNSILTFNVLIPNATTSNTYKFLVEEDGAGVITISQSSIYFERKVVS